MELFLKDLQQLGSIRPTGKSTVHFKPQGAEVCMRLYPRRATIRLENIWVEVPKRGTGSNIMQFLCDLADRHGLTITLTAIPFGDPATAIARQKLVGWYRRFGFLIHYDDNRSIDLASGAEMIREPRPSID